MLGTVLYAVDDLALQGTVFEEASLVYIVYGAVLGVMGGVVLLGAEALGQRTVGRPRWRSRSRCSASLATVLASFPHYIAGFLDQPAGPVYDNDDLADLEHPRARRPRPDGRSPCWRSSACCCRRTAADGDDATTIGDDPWDGQTLEWATTSPAPGDNFVDVPVVHSAEPMLDLKASQRAAPDRREQHLMYALPAGPTPAPARQTLVGMALASVSIVMLTGGMLAVWLLQRDRGASTPARSWLPERRRHPRGARQHHAHRLHRRVRVRPVGGLVAPSTTTVATPCSPSAATVLVALLDHQRPGLHLHPDGPRHRRRASTRRCSTPSPACSWC